MSGPVVIEARAAFGGARKSSRPVGSSSGIAGPGRPSAEPARVRTSCRPVGSNHHVDSSSVRSAECQTPVSSSEGPTSDRPKSPNLSRQPSPTVARPWSSHESPTLHKQPSPTVARALAATWYQHSPTCGRQWATQEFDTCRVQ